MAESCVKKVVRSLVQSLADGCDEELAEVKAVFTVQIKEHLVEPVLQKIYKDLFPYVCAVSAVLVIILVFVLLLMAIILMRYNYR